MVRTIPMEILRSREYWTPRQAARVLGRSNAFWQAAFDQQLVEGYSQKSPGGRRYRYLSAQSCRSYLDRLSNEERAKKPPRPDPPKPFPAPTAVRNFHQEIEGAR